MPTEREVEIQKLISSLRNEFPEEKSGLRHPAYELKLRQMAETEIRRRTVAEAEEKKVVTRQRNGTPYGRHDSTDGTGSFADRACTPVSENFESKPSFNPNFFHSGKGHGLNTSEHRPGHNSRKRKTRRET